MTALLLGVAPLFWFQTASAGIVSNRSIRIDSSLPSANTTHRLSFTYQSYDPVGSVMFEYCTNSPRLGDICNTPTGLSLSNAVITSQTGEVGFTIDGVNSTANKLVLTRSPVSASALPSTYAIGNVDNQTGTNQTAYVRIATYASTDATGSLIDEGAVAYSTASAVSVNGYVPPYLIFCVGITVALNCTNMGGTLLNFGELSSRQPRALSSQFSVATNDPTGYNAFVNGPTMISGSNIIPGMASPSPSSPGISQFGINLRANSIPDVGAEPIGVGSAVVKSNFAQPNRYYFNNEALASSPKSTNFNAFTVSYLVNINGSQPAGVYSTTLTYTAVVSF